jgi:preprotein translocase subunit SecE
MADKIKIVLAILGVAAGIAGFYALGDQAAAVLKLLSVVAGVAVGVAFLWTTAPGRRFVDFSRDSIGEAKKVVWPNRKETMQTTGIVFGFVVVMAVFLWLTDKSLEVVLYDFVLGWK